MPIAGPVATLVKSHKTTDTLELEVGDLVMWLGKQNEYSTLSRRIIYTVVERLEKPEGQSYVQYRFRPVFDIENPVGTSTDPTAAMTAREMKKLTLLDVATLRLYFDNFIREWAKLQGADVDDVR